MATTPASSADPADTAIRATALGPSLNQVPAAHATAGAMAAMTKTLAADNPAVHTPAPNGSGPQTPAAQTPAESWPAGAPTAGASRPSLADIIQAQEEIFVGRQPESARLAALANTSLAGGVVSSWQISRPQPVWLSHGTGSKLYDVDGNEYVDLHGGYGVSLAGHGHPAIVRAVKLQVERGTHFAQPTEAAIAAATELSARFGLPQWRFANSG